LVEAPMRITRETLLKVARDNADLHARQDRSIVTVYLIGSLLGDEPLIGGVTDVDLVMIHNGPPAQERELVRLSDEVHLDITHQPQSLYQQPRQLRVEPWLGPAIYATSPLHDTQHWFEFAQASVRSQFTRADYALERAKPFAAQARQTWLHSRGQPALAVDPVEALAETLQIVAAAANAVASLTGAPLTARRFLLAFPQRAQAVGQPDLYGRLLALLGAGQVEAGTMRGWLPAWGEAFDAAGQLPSAPLRLHPYRRLYFERAFEALLAGDTPHTALWPLLTTWTQALAALHGAPSYLEPWMAACRQLALTPEAREHSLSALDAFLDTVEEILDRWAQDNGISL
jgi:hypothetical protein